MKEYIIDDEVYVEVNEPPVLGGHVVSSEQLWEGVERTYQVYHLTENSRTVLGKYSRGACSLHHYRTLKRKSEVSI